MDEPKQKKWFQKKRYWIGGLILFLILVLGNDSSQQNNVQNFDYNSNLPANAVNSIQSQETSKKQVINNENIDSQNKDTKQIPPDITNNNRQNVENSVNTTQSQNCNPNYSGCLRPDASDYDCAGGSGNGPYYTGTVRVIGYDEYGLDKDGDGLGCE